MYIFSPAIIDRLSLRPTSMEREVLPQLATEDQLYCMPLDGYWMNVKKPRDFLQVTCLPWPKLGENFDLARSP